jgi:hypothetical protein
MISFKTLHGDTCSCSLDKVVPHWVHSESLRESCDIVIDWGANLIPRARRFKAEIVRHFLLSHAQLIPRGARIHVKSDHLPFFFGQLLPLIREPVILISGDSDYGGVKDYERFIKHPKLYRWFAQNCELSGKIPKLIRIPIGFDNPVFAKLDKRMGRFLLNLREGRPFASNLRNERGDQQLFNAIADSSDQNFNRQLLALCTFHQFERLKKPNLNAPGREERREAYRVLRENMNCHFVDKRLRQEEYWSTVRRFAFEVSPLGKGLDCHRTWEALASGTIPIVKASSLDEMYRENDLPVVIVADWTEITQENLQHWAKSYLPRFNARLNDRLSADYWNSKIREASVVCAQISSDSS